MDLAQNPGRKVVRGWADENCEILYITRYLIMDLGYPYVFLVNICYPMLSFYFFWVIPIDDQSKWDILGYPDLWDIHELVWDNSSHPNLSQLVLYLSHGYRFV